ncbi:MAG: hypothetical protein DPW09_33340 [Anaerolineae bacterium]|nr:hypothetical protein [Anaerolineales bacterium]MCQ3978337.1 hypothetical protein [Anaerolineae bacterium]
MREARNDLSYHQRELDEAQTQVRTLEPEVNRLVHEVADRLIVDEQGQPIDGGIYWFSHMAIVRVGSIVSLIPMQTLDEEKVFSAPQAEKEAVPEPALNGRGG